MASVLAQRFVAVVKLLAGDWVMNCFDVSIIVTVNRTPRLNPTPIPIPGRRRSQFKR
jgi:hypothetical protein